MGIREDFVNYWDGNGLLAPDPQPANPVGRASGNGAMYTSEYYIMLEKLGILTEQDKKDFSDKINACIDSNGLLNRAPVPTDPELEGPDDYYGVLSACKTLGNTEIPRKFLSAVIRYQGFLNNSNPGTRTLRSFLIRQPQLLCAMIAAAFPSWKNPLHILIRNLFHPLFLISAGIIFISCIGTASDNTDPRRLGWHLIQTLQPVSPLCKIAAQFWFCRLYNVYGASGMKAVALIYYHPNSGNPYSRWWQTE